MITLPGMSILRTRQEGVTAFAGLNHNLRIGDNEFYDMRNMTSDLLPVMASRKPRQVVQKLTAPNGIFAHERLCWVDGDGFYYDGVRKGSVIDGWKQFVRMGAYVLIFPDKAYYNTESDEFGTLEAEHKTSGEVTAELCRLDGEEYGAYTKANAAPGEPANGDLWLDTSGESNVLKQYSSSSQQWVSIPTVYTKISSPGIGSAFAQHDGVTISGFEDEALTGSFFLVQAAQDYIVVVALISDPVETDEEITIKRSVPDVDFVVEHDNRIWGCSSRNHEIYASALGDPKNWYQFMGIASDSYAVTVGTPGDFTGAATHNGYVMFFKPDCVHILSGNRPSNYQLTSQPCRGVASGSDKSLCMVNETLYYWSTGEACAFGSMNPYGISNAIGTKKLINGIGGAMGSKYYLSLQNTETHRRSLYVYDTQIGVWIREDEAETLDFATLDGELYMLTGDGTVWRMVDNRAFGHEPDTEDRVEWMLETGDIGFDRQAAQFVSKVQLHAQCEAHCDIRVDIQYDGDGRWEEIYSCSPVERRSLVIPIIPKRARFIRLRLRGEGDFRLYSLTMRMETGSDQYVKR